MVQFFLTLTTQRHWIVQFDVKSTFLNGMLIEEDCIEYLVGFTIKVSQDKICNLEKVLYNLKQAPRAWYRRIDNYFLTVGFG